MPARGENSGETAETAQQAAGQASQGETATAAPPSQPAEMPQPAKARPSRATAPKRPQPVTRKLPQAEAGISNRKCQWPIGDPSQPDFHFCESPAAPGRPYCAEHCAMAYITRSKDKGSEAA
ncbi:GcrA family cell cycle regulator [Fodinicurvata halophila]